MKWYWWLIIGIVVVIIISYFIYKNKTKNKNCVTTKEGIKCFDKPTYKNGDPCILPNERGLNYLGGGIIKNGICVQR